MPQSPQYTGQTWTVAELLEAVKDEAALPDSSRFTDEDILRTADQAIASVLTEPLIRSMAFGGRTLDWLDIPASDGLALGSEFFVPNRAASSDIAHVDYYGDGQHFARLDQVDAAESVYYQPRGTLPTHYYFKQGRLILCPRPSSVNGQAKLRLWYPVSHPKLVVTTDNVGVTSALSDTVTTGGTGNIAFTASLPANLDTAREVDVYSAYSPHTPLMLNLVVEDTSPVALDFSGGPDNTADYVGLMADSAAKVAPAGLSDCVQLPGSFRKALTCLTASYLLGQIGDTAEANRLTGVFGNEWNILKASVTPRAKGPALIHKNRRSYSRARAWAWWW